MKYFRNINTLEELRKVYKELLKIHHPDNGGNVAEMQEINAEYDKAFNLLKNRHATADKGTNEHYSEFRNKQYDFSEDKALREMLEKIITFSGITIEVVGNWIYIFNSYEFRKELKELGFKWASKKKAWYWHSETFRKKGRKALSMDDIRNYYGSTEVKTEERKQLKQA